MLPPTQEMETDHASSESANLPESDAVHVTAFDTDRSDNFRAQDEIPVLSDPRVAKSQSNCMLTTLVEKLLLTMKIKHRHMHV